MNKVADWLDERTGYRALMSHALDEEIRGGARWAYVFGSGLLAIFTVQAITGLMLMATYTPAINDAWSSVFYVQHRVASGWFIRGLHHYGAQAMVIVLGMHLLQVALYGAYRKPREVTWWFGLGLLGVVQGLALTGYLLPWDQKGYWATKVATNIAGTLPVIGPAVQTLIVGGAEYGQATLTRFYVLHVGVLPATLVMLVSLHVALFRKHGATPPAGADLSKVERFYPGQLLRDVVFAVLVIGVIAILTEATHGAHLDAPADPSVDYPPRPEWYFLFLFQLLKYIPGELELVGTVVLPGLAGAFLFALPLLDRGESSRVRHRLKFLVPILLGGIGIVALTSQSLADDAADKEYQAAVADSQHRAERAITLAKQGIPPGGPLVMLNNDPLTYGADLYAQQCTSCHVLDGVGDREAPEHTAFGSRKWILGLLHDPRGEKYFGPTEIDDMKSMSKLGEPSLKAITEFLFSLGHEKGDPAYDLTLAREGKALFKDKCMDCHMYEGDGDFNGIGGPDLTQYGSRTWIRKQVATPEAIYGELNDMPVFAEEMTAHDLDMVTAFLRLQRLR